MPKYWGKQILAHGRFPEVGQKQKTERKKEREGGKRLNDGDNNGQTTHGARKSHGPILRFGSIYNYKPDKVWNTKVKFYFSCWHHPVAHIHLLPAI